MTNLFRYQLPYPLGGTDGEPEPREKRLARGQTLIREMREVGGQIEQYLRTGFQCPIKLDRIHCPSCYFMRNGECVYNQVKQIKKG